MITFKLDDILFYDELKRVARVEDGVIIDKMIGSMRIQKVKVTDGENHLEWLCDKVTIFNPEVHKPVNTLNILAQ